MGTASEADTRLLRLSTTCFHQPTGTERGSEAASLAAHWARPLRCPRCLINGSPSLPRLSVTFLAPSHHEEGWSVTSPRHHAQPRPHLTSPPPCSLTNQGSLRWFNFPPTFHNLQVSSSAACSIKYLTRSLYSACSVRESAQPYSFRAAG